MTTFGAAPSQLADLMAVPLTDLGDGDANVGTARAQAALDWAASQILGVISPALRAWIAALEAAGPASLASLAVTGSAWRLGARLHASDGPTDAGLPHPVATWRDQWIQQLADLRDGRWIPHEYADDQEPPPVQGFAQIDFSRG